MKQIVFTTTATPNHDFGDFSKDKFSATNDVTQTPILWRKQGDDATIHCNHTKSVEYSQMYWYRQLPGETMKLIVFTTTVKPDHDFGDFSKDKFSNLVPEDKGLYFCAVSKHSDTDTCES
uniref:Ig-like domain-containing protein n=1 Tax=Lates calcarifer TaxID=8187 RepID=A0A4W6FUT5_LATCA